MPCGAVANDDERGPSGLGTSASTSSAMTLKPTTTATTPSGEPRLDGSAGATSSRDRLAQHRRPAALGGLGVLLLGRAAAVDDRVEPVADLRERARAVARATSPVVSDGRYTSTRRRSSRSRPARNRRRTASSQSPSRSARSAARSSWCGSSVAGSAAVRARSIASARRRIVWLVTAPAASSTKPASASPQHDRAARHVAAERRRSSRSQAGCDRRATRSARRAGAAPGRLCSDGRRGSPARRGARRRARRRAPPPWTPRSAARAG